MSDKIKIVRIFIGSPGGLVDERQTAHDVVKEVNRDNSEHWGCHIKLLGWEDVIPGYDRPQRKINEDVDKCDYFLGILWNRWGSRPSTDIGGYTSGFEEEFYRARQRIEDGRMKDMLICFKTVTVPPGMKPGEDIEKVLNFRQKCIDEKKVFFKDIVDLKDFRDVVRGKLMEIGWRETEIVQSADQRKSQSVQAPRLPGSLEGSDIRESLLIDEESQTFLSEISQKTSEWDKTKPHEIARFRLIASSLNRMGNDELYLGNHDANMVYRHLRDSPLSVQEVKALIGCGIVDFQNQNVPLWRWIAKDEQGGEIFDRVRMLAGYGNNQEKKNAIQILGLAAQPIPSIVEIIDKKEILTDWLSDETDNLTFETAISFLSSNAGDDDILLLEEASIDCSPQRKIRVEAAIVGILSRSSVDAALKRLVEKEIDTIETDVVECLFESPLSLATETVTLCLSAISDGVRLRAVQLLFERDEITLEAAGTLLTDSNYEIRLVAVESMKKLGHELNSDLVRKVLIFEKKPSTFGIGIFQSKETDATYHERYLSNRLAELDLPALKEKVANAGVFNDQVLSVMYSKFGSKAQDEIRNNLKDCYKSYFDAAIRKVEDAGTVTAKLIPKMKELETFHRKNLCTLALTALCNIAKAKDIILVRRTIDEFEVDGGEIILKFLARFGDRTDIDRIKNLGEYPSDRTGLMNITRAKLPDQKAGAILALGKIRIADMLALDLDSAIKKSLVKQLPKKVIVDLSDEILLRELRRDDDEYRIIFALRCIGSLSKSRVTALLKQYVDSGGHRYYNSVHWLDLGASFPQRLVKIIVERKLAQH